ncbi:PTS system mannose/fructose/sorbose family transporter subunit IID [Sneathia vaginalis]|nr:PTS system mannose/fructose/sorbose family transporter subunit IID [Sneathia vaginalis]MDK9582525.1 PTS system mannose/fructose/sorbose family transporter subunit IID [Sneathia vaginalis]
MKTFNENENKVITDKELKRVFWRSFQMEFSWNYERQMSLAYVYALIPVLEKIYTKKKN